MTAYTNYSDQELTDLLYKGDRNVFGLVFKEYYAALCYFANKFVLNKEESEDIVEEVFEKFWRGDRRVQSSTHLRSYLYMATKRACIDHLRKNEHAKERQMKFAAELGDEQAEYIHEMIKAEVLREIYVEIQNLPAQCGRIISMSFLEGLKNEEIAESLGISVQTVKNQKSKGLAVLKGKLSPQHMMLFAALGVQLIN